MESAILLEIHSIFSQSDFTQSYTSLVAIAGVHPCDIKRWGLSWVLFVTISHISNILNLNFSTEKYVNSWLADQQDVAMTSQQEGEKWGKTKSRTLSTQLEIQYTCLVLMAHSNDSLNPGHYLLHQMCPYLMADTN